MSVRSGYCVVCPLFFRQRNTTTRLPQRLKQYPIPDDIRDCMELEQDVTFVRPVLLEPLSASTHQEIFSSLVCCEELQLEKNIRAFDMFCVRPSPHRTIETKYCFCVLCFLIALVLYTFMYIGSCALIPVH